MDDLLREIEKLERKVGTPRTKAQLDEAQELLDVGREDLKASKLTHDGGVFVAAASNLQQAVEKTAKAYYGILGVLDEKTIRQTSHNSPELFLRMVELPWAQKFGELAGKLTSSDVVTDTSEAQSVVDVQAKRAEIARLDSKQIRVHLSLVPALEEKLTPVFAIMNKDLVMTMLRLYLLSALTFPHAVYPRYPDGGLVKPKEYTDQLGIIAAMDAMWAETEAAISGVQRIIDYSRTQ